MQFSPQEASAVRLARLAFPDPSGAVSRKGAW
jgi:hypothetical protein